VLVTWPHAANRARNTPFTIFDGNTSRGTIVLNQQLPLVDGIFSDRRWASLGVFEITTGVVTVQLNDHADGVVIADGVIVVPPICDHAPPPPISTARSGGGAGLTGSTVGGEGTNPPSTPGPANQGSSLPALPKGLGETSAPRPSRPVKPVRAHEGRHGIRHDDGARRDNPGHQGRREIGSAVRPAARPRKGFLRTLHDLFADLGWVGDQD
jgi:hypothetical protein